MSMDRAAIDSLQPMLRNVPLRPRQWRDMMNRDDVVSISSETVELALVPRDGQLHLYYAFSSAEEARSDFLEVFNELADDIEEEGWPYTRIDLVELPNRIWIETLLGEADFRPFSEWMELERLEMRADDAPPEIPSGYTMRRGTAADHEAVLDLEALVLGDRSDGEEAMRLRLESGSWLGVLERDGDIVAYAINGEVQGAEGRIASTAVHPDHWRTVAEGTILAAAAYQLASREATKAVVELYPDIGGAVRAALDRGFVAGRRGVELRRPTDEETRRELRQADRVTGVKARFGNWR